MRGKNKIKVDRKIKPIHFNLRKPFPIEIGGSYYFSIGKNEVFPCKVIKEIIDDDSPRTILIEIDFGPNKSRNYVKVDEIGRTPEEAVINTFTF